MDDTLLRYDRIREKCREVFLNKMKDYGTAWRILRPESVTDQILIKARRIKNIEVTGTQKVEDDLPGEFAGIVNYAIIGLIQLGQKSREAGMEAENALHLYDDWFLKAKDLMVNKNHDYGEAWKDMRVSSYTDLILMKLHRIKQIEDNQGLARFSEGIDANYLDIVNYAIFALIKSELNP